ncbi:hypothetical protein Ddye_027299 [Dipteronia dyeriana]|uniref:Uncharacterized protein n=1 Tax=Dipteronia dyeriana TaxID=168575 RepID=A0AAD9TNT5_9ROSI|nr:hypothetical protein Ddye_027299 [Dipteronia dyeriana]
MAQTRARQALIDGGSLSGVVSSTCAVFSPFRSGLSSSTTLVFESFVSPLSVDGQFYVGVLRTFTFNGTSTFLGKHFEFGSFKREYISLKDLWDSAMYEVLGLEAGVDDANYNSDGSLNQTSIYDSEDEISNDNNGVEDEVPNENNGVEDELPNNS